MLCLTFPTLLLKNLQKSKKCHFQRLKTFVAELEVASKPFSKVLPRTKFWFKHLPLKSLQKTEKWDFQRFTTFGFDLKVVSKPFSKILPMNNLEFKKLLFVCLTLPQKWFQLAHRKIGKKVKNAILKRWGDSASSKVSFYTIF